MDDADHPDAEQVHDAVQANWDLGPTTLEHLPGGMNSSTWTVSTRPTRVGLPGRRWVAKFVGPGRRAAFTRGLDAAVRLQTAGIPAGAPEPTRAGHLHVDAAGGALALLRWVDGHPLSGADADEQTSMGTTLGAAHRALRERQGPGGPGSGAFPGWVDVEAEHLQVEGWIRPAVRGALHGYADLAGTSLTWGLLHGDPGPEDFLRSPSSSTGQQRCGLIDWGSAMHGPLLYDLASAVFYLGRPERAGALLQAYARTAALAADEIDRGLEVLLRLRWAVQADYFAYRLVVDDRTGISDPSENLTGLQDAREFFAAQR